MCAGILGEVPEPNAAAAITTNDLALIRMDDDVIHRRAVVVASLDRASPCFPYLHGAVLGARHHPFALAVKCDPSHIASMSRKYEQRGGVGRADVEELDGVVAGGGEEALVGGDA